MKAAMTEAMSAPGSGIVEAGIGYARPMVRGGGGGKMSGHNVQAKKTPARR
jgi:hypothetical protein